MAIYHFEAKAVSRGSGRSAVAAAAYMSCSEIHNEYDGVTHDFTRKRGLVWQQVFNVIDSRYRSKKPLIITTNLTLDELKHPKDLAHARIYDRVLERCVPLKVNRQNIRQLNAANTLRSAKKLFSTEEEV